ncbi:MAG: hypothetical protein J0I20_22590 [Chloroflexi bacterium]|nr:hypothetical protein [Chloroflexota bacterium]OJV99165.1 MAG: hypothetical protein BGO39_17060 [Chloroflexi bacterium 54-19]
MLNIFRSRTRPDKDNTQAGANSSARPVPKKEVRRPTPAQPVTDQTIEYLKGADPDDILELMLPALVQEQQRRLTSTAKELEEIDQKLAKLYASREDIYSVMAQNQANGATDF